MNEKERNSRELVVGLWQLNVKCEVMGEKRGRGGFKNLSLGDWTVKVVHGVVL